MRKRKKDQPRAPDGYNGCLEKRKSGKEREREMR